MTIKRKEWKKYAPEFDLAIVACAEFCPLAAGRLVKRHILLNLRGLVGQRFFSLHTDAN